jgi:O-acetyl-ADP-ribose deacetylase (regulator of RNase III)
VRLTLLTGDLTEQQVDVIVNAADPELLGGGGVDGAIHAAGGPGLMAECRQLRATTYPNGLTPGQAVATLGYQLPAPWVIHTVGPNRRRGQTDPDRLAACFTESLQIAAGLGARSLAFPAIGAGAFGWDVEQVARIAVAAVRSVLPVVSPPLAEVRFVAFSERARAAFAAALAESAAAALDACP